LRTVCSTEREDIDIDHQRSAVAALLAVAVAAERGGTGGAGDAGFFLHLARGGDVGQQRTRQIALGNDPPLRLARGDQHQPHLRIGGDVFEAVRQGGNLADGKDSGKSGGL
jgi:hypothetical protein